VEEWRVERRGKQTKKIQFNFQSKQFVIQSSHSIIQKHSAVHRAAFACRKCEQTHKSITTYKVNANNKQKPHTHTYTHAREIARIDTDTSKRCGRSGRDTHTNIQVLKTVKSRFVFLIRFKLSLPLFF